MLRKFFFCSALLLSLKAFAAAQMVYIDGAPYVDFGGGRKAVVSHALGKLNHGVMGLRQIENTCDPGQVLANCKMQMDFTSHTVSLRWADHTDKSKIGAIVKATARTTPPQTYEVKDAFGIYTWFASATRQQWTDRFNNDVLECDNYDWMKTLPVSGNRVLLQSWTGETMIPNPETGVNENQTTSGGFNIELEKNAAGHFTVAKIGATIGGEGTPPYISNSVSTITFLAGNSQQCQVAFEVSIEDIIKKVQSPGFYDADPATETPVKNPMDVKTAFSTVGTVKSILTPGADLGIFE